MKGTFFSKPLEWSVDVRGESWAQGENVAGTLTVKNHGAEAAVLEGAGVALALGDIKKVHNRDAKAFTDSASLPFPAGTSVAAGASMELPFQFTLPANCAITDKRATYFITYGKAQREAHLQMNIVPRKLFGEVIKLFETFLRWKLKEAKSGKKGVEYKLIPPSSRDWAHVVQLVLTMRLEGENLELHGEFTVKAIDTQAVTTALTKETRDVEKTLAPREYLMGKDMPDQDKLLKALEGILSGVKSKGF